MQPSDPSLQLAKISHAHVVAMSLGFTPIDVPWIVSEPSLAVTFSGLPLMTNGRDEHKGGLIGSGEQGFLEIWDKLSPDTKYVTTTPCFRVEQEYKPGIVEPWFLKTELIWVKPANPDQAVSLLLKSARRIMGCWARNLTETKTAEGVDLYLAGHEVGSYGYRSIGGRSWAYGTGLAEPRFTTALRSYKEVITIGKPKK